MKKAGTALLIVTFTLLGCERGEPALEPIDTTIEFGSGSALVTTATDTFSLGLEVAETQAQRSRGLMQRESLAPDSGMVFLFDAEQPPEAAFYMYRTLIPLSIAFLDADGTIRNIVDMQPCTYDWPQWCPNYAAEVPFQSAVEVNLGYFDERGIDIGDRVILQLE